MGTVLTLLACVSGIYISFISWSVFHEKITSSSFDNVKFNEPLFIQLVQNLLCFFVGLSYLRYKYGNEDAEKIEQENAKERKTNCKEKVGFFQHLYGFYFSDPNLMKYLFLVSITSSLAAPIANTALNHVDFVTYLLAKSCKLIPVLLIHTFYYKKIFPVSKYLIAVMITFGIFLFSYKKSSVPDKNTVLDTSSSPIIGLVYLFVSLILDGVTNATQDQMFKMKFNNKAKLSGIHLMISLNFISFLLSLLYSTILTRQFQNAITFICKNPVILQYILCYSLVGSIGQIFIYITLEKFDSIILITINVTRKMFSMLLSLVLFNHKLNRNKVMGIFFVFLGIGLESYLKYTEKKSAAKIKLKTL